MSPLPGSHVIHPRMLPALSTIAQNAQTGAGRLLSPSGTSTFDATTGRSTPAAPTVMYVGTCRVQPKQRMAAPVVHAGEQPVTLPDFQITVPISVAAEVHMLWEMTACTDTALVGKTFTVLDVAYGTLQAERHLVCSLNETDD